MESGVNGWGKRGRSADDMSFFLFCVPAPHTLRKGHPTDANAGCRKGVYKTYLWVFYHAPTIAARIAKERDRAKGKGRRNCRHIGVP